ncbi:hypothetical protein ABH920_006359 [Catenulispora sp. EB89]|uniref:hypothetical protein n=1 Tax=Catenulispora sp. EB89 TaxID=3156257 RepID=UPI00351621DC
MRAALSKTLPKALRGQRIIGPGTLGTALVGAGMGVFAAPAALAASLGDDSGVIAIAGQAASANG